MFKNLKKKLNKELLAINKKDEVTVSLHARLRSTGGQPARHHELAYLHKKLHHYDLSSLSPMFLMKKMPLTSCLRNCTARMNEPPDLSAK